jgi:DNA-binding XRE family transcriptional regulator
MEIYSFSQQEGAEMQGALQTMNLYDIRSQFRLTQQELADEAGVHLSTIRNSERGVPIYRRTAYNILDAINRRREKRGMLTLTIEDIDWKVR